MNLRWPRRPDCVREELHVFPIDDLIDHHLGTNDGGCICGPAIESVHGFRLVTHHALDGREHTEPDHDRDTCPVCADAPRPD
jgi:hypothetical protein